MKRKSLLAQILIALLIITGCAHRVNTDPTQPVKPPTTWEKITTTNAEIATVNNGVAQGIIAASDAKALADEYAIAATTINFNVAAWQQELTPLLADQATAKANSGRIEILVKNILNSAGKLIASGNAGIKNASNAAQLAQAADSLQKTASSLYDLLKTAGVLK